VGKKPSPAGLENDYGREEERPLSKKTCKKLFLQLRGETTTEKRKTKAQWCVRGGGGVAQGTLKPLRKTRKKKKKIRLCKKVFERQLRGSKRRSLWVALLKNEGGGGEDRGPPFSARGGVTIRAHLFGKRGRAGTTG